jgi:hypothetical protein
MLKNFYETKSIKKFLSKSQNPHFDETQMKVDSRILIIGSSGSGKTNALLNYISICKNTFHSIHVVYKEKEPLYDLLEDKLEKTGQVFFYDNISKLPKVNDIQEEKNDQTLIIFDDQICCPEKQLSSVVGEYFIRGRKKKCTMIFISQSYYKIPKIIRQQMNYMIILKMSSNRDLKLIFSDFQFGSSVDEIEHIYNDATKQPLNFFKISVDEQDLNKKFSRNFTEFFQIKDESSSDEESSDESEEIIPKPNKQKIIRK